MGTKLKTTFSLVVAKRDAIAIRSVKDLGKVNLEVESLAAIGQFVNQFLNPSFELCLFLAIGFVEKPGPTLTEIS
jgi:hypothetical protein